MQINIKKNDVIWSYLNYGMSTVSNLLVILFSVAFLSNNELGIWYTFLSLGAIVQLVDFGFLPCITRNISFAWSGAVELTKSGIPRHGESATANYQLLRTIICTSRYVYSLMAIVVMIFGGVLGSIYVRSIYVRSISDAANSTGYMIAWLVYGLSLVINIYFGYWTGCLQGIGAIKENNLAKVVSYIVLIVVTVFCLFRSVGLLSMSIGNLASGIVYRVLAKHFFVNREGIKGSILLEKGKTSRSEVVKLLKIIWPNTWKMGINAFGTYFITQGNTLLCSAFLGLEATATYGLSLQICTAITTVAKILLTAYQPRLVELNLHGDKKETAKLFSMIMTVYWLIIVLAAIALAVVGIPLLGIIKSDTSLPYAVVFYMLLYLALEGNHSCFATYLTTQNEIPFFKAGLLSAIGVFSVSFILVKWTDWGIWALMLGQSLVQLAYNNWKWPHMVLKGFSINFFKMLRIGFGEISGKIKMVCGVAG